MDCADARCKEPDSGIAVTVREATLISGDGIGPEITAATLQAFDALGMKFDWDEEYGGMAAVEKAGTPLPNATLDSIRRTRLCQVQRLARLAPWQPVVGQTNDVGTTQCKQKSSRGATWGMAFIGWKSHRPEPSRAWSSIPRL